MPLFGANFEAVLKRAKKIRESRGRAATRDYLAPKLSSLDPRGTRAIEKAAYLACVEILVECQERTNRRLDALDTLTKAFETYPKTIRRLGGVAIDVLLPLLENRDSQPEDQDRALQHSIFLARAFLGDEDTENSLCVVRAALDPFPSDSRIRSLQIETLILRGDLRAATVALSNLIEFRPEWSREFQEWGERLLVRARAAGGDSAVGEAASLLGRLRHHIGDHAGAVTCWEEASRLLGGGFEEAGKLLHSYAFLGSVEPFVSLAAELLDGGGDPAVLDSIKAEGSILLSGNTLDAPLNFVLGRCHMELGQYPDAARHLGTAIRGDEGLAKQSLAVYREKSAIVDGDSHLLLGKAEALHVAGKDSECLAALRLLEKLGPSRAQLGAVKRVLAGLLEASPNLYAGHLLAARIKVRMEDLPGAVKECNRLLEAGRLIKRLAAFCESLRKRVSRVTTPGSLYGSILRLSCECHLRLGEHEEALDHLVTLAAGPWLVRRDLAWCRDGLLKILCAIPDHPGGRLLLGEILARMEDRAAAAKALARVVDLSPPEDLLQRAATGLEALLPRLEDAGVARAAIGKALLLLGKPRMARSRVLESLEGGHGDADEFLDLLMGLAKADDPDASLTEFLLEAHVLRGGPRGRSGALEHGARLLEHGEIHATFVDDQVGKLLEQRPTGSNLAGALLLRSRTLLALRRHEALADACRELREAVPGRAPDALPILKQAIAAAKPPTTGRLHLEAGRILLLPVPADRALAVRQLEQAARAGSKETGQEAMDLCLKLASGDDPFPPAALAACRTAIRGGEGSRLMPMLLEIQVLCEGVQLTEARELAEKTLAGSPDCGTAWLLAARIERRLEHPDAAVDAYRRVLELADEALVREVVQDLDAHRRSDEASDAQLRVLADAHLAAGSIREAREVLVGWVLERPGEAGVAAGVLEEIAGIEAATWRERVALGQACLLAGSYGKGHEALAFALEEEGADRAEVFAAIREARDRDPEDPDSRAVELALRCLHAEKKNRRQALEAVEASLEDEESPLRPASVDRLLSTLDDTLGRKGVGAALMATATRARARALELRGEAEASAHCLDALLLPHPGEQKNVERMARAALERTGERTYLLPLARSLALAGDPAGAVMALIDLGRESAAHRAEAEKRCRSLAADLEGPLRARAIMGCAELRLGQERELEAAEDWLAAAEADPAVIEESRRALQALREAHPEEPRHALAGASAELVRGEDGLQAACEILEALARSGSGTGPDEALGFLADLGERFPRRLDLRTRLLHLRALRGPGSFPRLVEDAERICEDFEEEGRAAVLAFLGGVLEERSTHVPLWYLQCGIHEIGGDVPSCLESLRTVARVALKQEEQAILERAIRYHPRRKPDPAVLVFQAEIESAMGRYAESARRYAEALERPNWPREAVGEGLTQLLRVAGEDGEVRTAAGRWSWLLGRAEDAALHYRAAAGADGALDLTATLEELTRAFPEKAAPTFVYGECRFRHGSPVEARALLERALDLGNLRTDLAAACHKLLCECHAVEGRIEPAMKHIVEACRLAPEDDEAASRLITLHTDRRRRRIADLRAEIEEQGENPERTLRLGLILKGDGDFVEAMRCFQRAAEDRELEPRCHLELAKCQIARSRCNLAAVNLRRVVEQSEHGDLRKEALYYLGTAHLRLFELEEAGAVFEELCALDEGYRDAARQLRRVQESKSRGAHFTFAEIPYDLMRVWKDVETRLLGEDEAGEESPDG